MTRHTLRTGSFAVVVLCLAAHWMVGCRSKELMPAPPRSVNPEQDERDSRDTPTITGATIPRTPPSPPATPKTTPKATPNAPPEVAAIPAPSIPSANTPATATQKPKPSRSAGNKGKPEPGGGSSASSTGKGSTGGASGGASGGATGGAGSAKTPAAGTQTKSEGEVDLSGKGQAGADPFGEEPTPPSGAPAPLPPGKPTVPAPEEPAKDESLDFGEVEPTSAPIPEGKPTDSSKAAATLVLPFRGSWRQQGIDQSSHADFAPGGYSARYLLFNEGMGEMRVYSGFGDPVKQVVAMRYQFLSKGDGRISIEPFPGAASSLELMPVGATAPRSLSSTITWTLGPDGTTMTLGGKTYVRASASECEAFATGEKQRPAPSRTETPTLAGLPWETGDTLIIVDAGQATEKRIEILGALRKALREQARKRRALLVGPKSTLPMTWGVPGTELILMQVANAEATGSAPLSPERLGDLLRSVPSTPNRVVMVAGGGITPGDLKELLTKRGWNCPVDVVLHDERDGDSWRNLATETGGRVRPE